MDKYSGRKVYTVSELNREIKTVLEATYPDIWVEGEITGLKTYESGHTYFTLKDAESRVSAVIFSGVDKEIRFTPEEGQRIIARGRVSSYPKRGDYQLIVNYAEPAGIGALQAAFEQLKAKLQHEGLFDEARKRAIPMLVQHIGIITSPDGAALRDILSVLDRRYANIEILIYPVKVQGEDAKYDITEAIEYLNSQHPELDVILAGRGGGSYEDLWAFNEELVARAIYKSKIPIISCVGHEVDFTIADFVADLRAPTPSAAAELVVRNKHELMEKIDLLVARLGRNMDNQIERYEDNLAYLLKSKVIEKPEGIFEIKMQRLDEILGRLQNAAENGIERSALELTHTIEKLKLISPLNVLERGYSICALESTGAIVTDSGTLKGGDHVKVTLHIGGFKGIVHETILSEKNS